MSEFEANLLREGDFPLKLEPDCDDSLENPVDPEVEVVMDDISDRYIGGDEEDQQLSFTGEGQQSLLIKQLLRRLEVLEAQVTSCMGNQPLLYQVFGKCNVLEQRLKVMKKDIDGRLTQLEKGSKSSSRNQWHTVSKLRPLGTSAPSEHAKKINTYGMDQDEIESGSGSSKEWEPDQEGDEEGGNLESLDAEPNYEPFSCKFCPPSPPLGFKDAESLANHYTSTHPLPDTDTNTPGPPKLRTSRMATRSHKITLAPDPHVPRNNRTCPKCRKIFATTSKRDDHLESAHHTFKCKVCHAKYASKKEVVGHRFEIHGIRHQPQKRKTLDMDAIAMVPCPDACGRTFLNKTRAQTHLIACRGLKPHNCPHCEKRFGYLRTLQDHVATAHGEGDPVAWRVICSECGRSIMRNALEKHMKTHVPKEERQRFYCDQCGVGCLDPQALRVHYKQHTEPDVPRVPCQLCDKTFKNSECLRTHMWLHTNRGRFVCDECGWGFTRPHLLRKHKANHAKGKARKTPWTLVAPTSAPPPSL